MLLILPIMLSAFEQFPKKLTIMLLTFASYALIMLIILPRMNILQ